MKQKETKMNNKGFSLVELIVVIAIMAVLVGVLAPQFIKYVERSREGTDIQNVDNVATALKTHFVELENVTGTVKVTITKTADPSYDANADSEAKAALASAGIEKVRLKGNWTSGITISYDAASGQTSFEGDADHYHTENGAFVSGKKTTTPTP